MRKSQAGIKPGHFFPALPGHRKNRMYTPIDRLAKVAEALGWMRCERLGREVWYDPTGGHVSWADLPKAIESDIAELVQDCLEYYPPLSSP